MPGSKLTDQSRQRLVALCGMLGSDFDGERANAGMMANRLIKSLGLTWNDVIAATGAAGGANNREKNRWQPPEPDPDPDHVTMAKFCLKSDLLWTPWEQQFLQDMVSRTFLSEKQEAVLARLYKKAYAGTI